MSYMNICLRGVTSPTLARGIPCPTLILVNYVRGVRSPTLLSLLTAERIWFKCDLYLRFIPPINLWKVCIDLRPFSKYFNEPFSRTLRSPRSNNLEIQNDENSTWKLVKTRWNDLGRGSVDFFKDYIFKISGSSWEKWAIARLSSQTFTNTSF